MVQKILQNMTNKELKEYRLQVYKKINNQKRLKRRINKELNKRRMEETK